ncbi:type II toxin-antitoxin system PemK/MazF family toxin [Polaromonas sp. YR568]|uniref:type II toxin-antitoxin system PemK/MazF family toxin n=1 Tax=Polaromonas sp. YR568 TaxID=1855301 RepID=UPI00398C1DC6
MDRDVQALQGPYPDTLKQGDIFWIEADPSRGAIPGSPHPHVIVQDDVFNRSRISTVIVCALTSKLNRATEPGNVLLEPGEGNLEKQSVVVVSQVSSVYKTRLGARIGSCRMNGFSRYWPGCGFCRRLFSIDSFDPAGRLANSSGGQTGNSSRFNTYVLGRNKGTLVNSAGRLG